MPVRSGIVALGACLLGVVYGSAWAQTATIEQRIEQLRPPAERPLLPEEAILTGKEDIVLLRRAKLFTLRAEAGYSFTNNAFLSDDLKDSDRIFLPSLTLRAGTRIAERYDVFAEVEAFAARYDDNPELDFDSFTGRLGGEMPLGDWLVGASYSATPVFEKGLDGHLVTLHDITLGARRVFPLDEQTALLPSFSMSRVFADPNDFSTLAGDAGVMVVRQLADGVFGLLGARAHVRRYDDFFEADTGETRVDYGGGGQASLVWRPVEWFSVNGTVEVTQNWSTVAVREYSSVGVTPLLSVNARF